MSDKKCPDCGEQLRRDVGDTGEWGYTLYHQQGGIECLKRQLAQLREQLESKSMSEVCPDCGGPLVAPCDCDPWLYCVACGNETVVRQTYRDQRVQLVQEREKNTRFDDALPKTIDGQSILPQMEVWFLCESTGEIEGPLRVVPFCEWEEPDDLEEGEIVSTNGIPWAMGQGAGRSAEDCYSTRAAAEAATEGQKP